MPIKYDIKTDYLYQQGFKEGIKLGLKQVKEQGIDIIDHRNKVAFVKGLLLHTDFDLSKIGMLVNVSLDFVKEVKLTLEK